MSCAHSPPAPAPQPAQHDTNCEYWLDQYPQECTCGVTRPKAAWFVPFKSPSP